MVVLDVDVVDESTGSVVVPYWFRLVCRLTSSVVMVIRWWTPVSAVGGALECWEWPGEEWRFPPTLGLVVGFEAPWEEVLVVSGWVVLGL